MKPRWEWCVVLPISLPGSLDQASWSICCVCSVHLQWCLILTLWLCSDAYNNSLSQTHVTVKTCSERGLPDEMGGGLMHAAHQQERSFYLYFFLSFFLRTSFLLVCNILPYFLLCSHTWRWFVLVTHVSCHSSHYWFVHMAHNMKPQTVCTLFDMTTHQGCITCFILSS